MDKEHKAKLSQGRADARAVKGYLAWLETNRPKRGRRRTRESINNRLAVIASERDSASPLARLSFFQEEADLEAELEGLDQIDDGEKSVPRLSRALLAMRQTRE